MIDSSQTFFFFFNDTATTEIYTLSLHDALPIYRIELSRDLKVQANQAVAQGRWDEADRKSTRLNSSHLVISYAVFCLKKKKITRKSFSTLMRLSLAQAQSPDVLSLTARHARLPP